MERDINNYFFMKVLGFFMLGACLNKWFLHTWFATFGTWGSLLDFDPLIIIIVFVIAMMILTYKRSEK